MPAERWPCAAEMRDASLASELERMMNQAVGISLGEAPAAALDKRLAGIARLQGSHWLDSSLVCPVFGLPDHLLDAW